MDGTQAASIAADYGAHYYQPGHKGSHRSRRDDLYFYEALIGGQQVRLGDHESLITLNSVMDCAVWVPGSPSNVPVPVNGFGVRFMGYQCGSKSVSLRERVNLPYVNGCATRQILPPERVGDPTLQQLTIPPYTSEQVHHIHPTARVVYVLSGRGYSVVGQGIVSEETVLHPGVVCILDPMCPHHFRTEGDYLTVLPVHVWSSPPGGLDNNHPMFNGTKEV